MKILKKGYTCRIHLVLLLCIGSLLPLQSQIIYHDQPPFANTAFIKQLVTETDSVWKNLLRTGFRHNRWEIIEMYNDLYLCPDGHFNVYNWQQNKWILISRKQGFGYNFNSKKFIYNHQIHSYGGYGFWRHHGDVIRFSTQDSSWHLLPFTAGLKGGIARHAGDGIYVYGPLAYYIDLKQEKIFTIKNYLVPQAEESDAETKTLDLGKYTLVEDQAVFIDPHAQVVYTSELALSLLKEGKPVQDQFFIHITGDSLTFYDKEGRIKSKHNFPSLTGPLETAIESTNEDSMLVFLSFGILLIMAGIIIWMVSHRFFQKKSRFRTIDGKEMEIANMVQSLINSPKRIYTTEELDIMLQISVSSSPDSQRVKRAQYVRDINNWYFAQYGVMFIIRKPNPSDGRKNIYEILL